MRLFYLSKDISTQRSLMLLQHVLNYQRMQMHFHQHVLKLNYKDKIEKEKKSNEHNNPKLKSVEKKDKKYQSTTTIICPY
jgi:hypothetical protein